jgi:hypothetical protein
MRLNDEPLSASLDFNQAVQSDCVEKIEFHGFAIGASTRMSDLIACLSFQAEFAL